MPRDIGNEVIVAIVAVGVLAFALTFGIILSLSNPQPEATEAVVFEASVEASRTATSTPVPSGTDEPTTAPTATAEPSATDTDTATPTNTAAPTNTSTATRTPTLTDTATDLPTDIPTATTTPTPTTTSTSTRRPTERVSALSTDTDTPSPSRTRTSTPTASDTNTPRPTWTPTRTPISTRTSTPAATRQPTNTLTATDRPTRTASPTATVSSTPTPRIVPTVTPLATATGNSPTPEHVSENICIAPFGWIEYVIRSGDNLFTLARATGTTVDDLRDANCLDNIDRINVGTHLYIPGPIARQYANADMAEPEAQGCTDPDSVILRPLPGEAVRGVFRLVGTASDDDFAYYRLDLRANDADGYTLYSRHDRRVLRDELGIIDSDLFSPGLYWVRLSIYNDEGEIAVPPCAIPVIFE